MSAWDNIIAHALSGTGGAAITGLASWWMWFRKDRRDDHADERDGTKHALDAMEKTMARMEGELDRLRERQEASERAEEQCKASLRTVREALHAMANALMAAKIPLPVTPGWPIKAGDYND